MVKSKYLIDRTYLGQREIKVDTAYGYMIGDISYSIVLLSRFMGLPTMCHLET